MNVSRRGLLQTGCAGAVAALMPGSLFLPRVARAQGIDHLSASLAVAEMGANFMAGRHAAAAGALQNEALVTFLNGISQGVTELLGAMAQVIAALEELKAEQRQVIVALRDEENRARIVGVYSTFLGDRSSLHKRTDLSGSVEEVEHHRDNVNALLKRLVEQRESIMRLSRHGMIEPAISMCVALRAEMDMRSELEALGRRQGWSAHLRDYVRYFSELLDPQNSDSLTVQERNLVSEQRSLIDPVNPEVAPMKRLLENPGGARLFYSWQERDPEPPHSNSINHYQTYALQIDAVCSSWDSLHIVKSEYRQCSIPFSEPCDIWYGQFEPIRGVPNEQIASFNSIQEKRTSILLRIAALEASGRACEAGLAMARAALAVEEAHPAYEPDTEARN